ncbi:hypothetical protein, partial [Hoeflea sp.]|uniref:hypothetical protein n=1 Tax=Hoeflea sp. TaxID=1940281 RepID=UPI003A9237BF
RPRLYVNHRNRSNSHLLDQSMSPEPNNQTGPPDGGTPLEQVEEALGDSFVVCRYAVTRAPIVH